MSEQRVLKVWLPDIASRASLAPHSTVQVCGWPRSTPVALSSRFRIASPSPPVNMQGI